MTPSWTPLQVHGGVQRPPGEEVEETPLGVERRRVVVGGGAGHVIGPAPGHVVEPYDLDVDPAGFA